MKVGWRCGRERRSGTALGAARLRQSRYGWVTLKGTRTSREEHDWACYQIGWESLADFMAGLQWCRRCRTYRATVKTVWRDEHAEADRCLMRNAFVNDLMGSDHHGVRWFKVCPWWMDAAKPIRPQNQRWLFRSERSDAWALITVIQ